MESTRLMGIRQKCVVFALLALLSQFSWAGMASVATVSSSPTRPLAVLYDEADEGKAGADYSRIIAGIEGMPDVVVYRIALNGGEYHLAAANMGSRLSGGLKLAFNGSGQIAVIYPDIGEPYRTVFSNIIEGIEDQAKTRVATFAVGSKQNAEDIEAELRRQNIQVVIVLGRNGLKAAANLNRDIGVVVGGVLSAPESETRGMSVFSLAPDPQLLFERLRKLMPAVRRVIVVYEPQQNAWLIRLAREAAKAHGLELVALEANDLKAAMLLYKDVIGSADPKRDALWLPQDSVTVEESSVLPLVLQEAWNRSLIVFSSSVTHVRRGALFSLYPNNIGLGRKLADSALGRISAGGAGTRTMEPLKEVLWAVNVRTASHLGLDVGYRQQQSFDLVFPQQ